MKLPKFGIKCKVKVFTKFRRLAKKLKLTQGEFLDQLINYFTK